MVRPSTFGAWCVAVFLAAGCGSPGMDDGEVAGVVTEVIDGDTLEVEGVGRVRLIGVDTPERGECGFDAASQALADLVEGRSVVLLPGAADDVDRYDRLLRYVEVDGDDAGLSLIESGLAVSRYDSRDGYGEHEREQAYVTADEKASVVAGCSR